MAGAFTASASVLGGTAAASAITYFGSASNPSDNGANAGPGPAAVTPPASMVAGDLAVVIQQVRTSSLSDTNLFPSVTGGQTWQRVEIAPQTVCSVALWCCRFNGTWAANPSFENTNLDTTALTVVMHVFRPPSGQYIDLDLQLAVSVHGTFNNTGTTKTITGMTTATAGDLVLAIWCASDDITWGTLTAGWTAAGSAQYRNTTGSDQSNTCAYQVFAAAGATGNIAQTQSIATAGSTIILAFRKLTPPTSATKPTVQVFTDFEASVNATPITTTILGLGTHSGGETWTWAENNPSVPFYFVATAAEVALGNSVTQNSTDYNDSGATRGFNMDFSVATALSTSYYVISRSASVTNMSASFMFSTNVPQEFVSYTVFGILPSDATGLSAFNVQTQGATTVETYLENSDSLTYRGPSLELNTNYRICLLFRDTDNLSAMAIYFPSTNEQHGFTVCQKCVSTNPSAPDRVYIGQFGGGLGHTVSAHMYIDDLLINTSGVFPLLPGP